MADTIRESIADQIVSDNPTYVVKAFAAAKPEIEKTTVYIYREALVNSPQTACVVDELKVVVMVPGLTQTLRTENELEEILTNVLRSINSLNFTQWTRADRTTFFENYSGYEIAVQTNTKNIYKLSA